MEINIDMICTDNTLQQSKFYMISTGKAMQDIR